MDDSRARRLNIWTPLLFSLVLIIGMIFGFRLRDTLRVKRDIQTVITRNDRLEQLIDLINEKYVDTLSSNLLYQDAIDGILSHLDPHTVYIPAEQVEEVNQDLEGSFFGIGVEFSIIRDTMQVTYVFDGGPASNAGLETGDQIIKVEDSVVAGRNINSDRIIKMLKGKEYSKVFITVKKVASDELRPVTIKRGAIPIYSVEASIMLDSITGFIKINRFSATTYEEFKAALKSLQKKGMEQLVVDLRQNPGGYLEAAADIADEFLEGNKLIVYTKGKHSTRSEYYRAGSKKGFEKGRLVILVDENSASASEILAGAIQDWDRGVIIGRRTFGKGLVQEQYTLDDGAALRLTIAKYYTPSGRSIQRSYAKGKEVYEQDFLKRYQTGEFTGSDTIGSPDTTKFFTAGKRVVYSGNGITPDIYVPYDTARYNPALMNLLYNDDVKRIVWDYYLRHRSELAQYKTITEFASNFRAEDLLKTWENAINAKTKKTAAKILKQPADNAYFRLQLKAQLARILFRDEGFYTISSQTDNMVQRALKVLHTDAYLKVVGRQLPAP